MAKKTKKCDINKFEIGELYYVGNGGIHLWSSMIMDLVESLKKQPEAEFQYYDSTSLTEFRKTKWMNLDKFYKPRIIHTGYYRNFGFMLLNKQEISGSGTMWQWLALFDKPHQIMFEKKESYKIRHIKY